MHVHAIICTGTIGGKIHSPVGPILGVDVGRWEGPGQSGRRLPAQLVRGEKGRGLVEILTSWGQSL